MSECATDSKSTANKSFVFCNSQQPKMKPKQQCQDDIDSCHGFGLLMDKDVASQFGLFQYRYWLFFLGFLLHHHHFFCLLAFNSAWHCCDRFIFEFDVW